MTIPTAKPDGAFVDGIGGSVRLDLNDGVNLRTLKDWSMPTPPLRRAVVDSLTSDGGDVPSSFYGMRELTIPLALQASTQTAVDAVFSSLVKELNRPRNYLRWKVASSYRYFIIERSPTFDWEKILLDQFAYRKPVLTLLAQPLCYGDVVNLGPYTISNDPAAATANTASQLFIPAANILGDIEADPVVYVVPPTATVAGASEAGRLRIGTRRRGVPATSASARHFTMQAESLTTGSVGYGAGTVVAGSHDAAMSGAGNNYVRTTFSATTDAARISFLGPGDQNDAVGWYRLLVRIRRGNAAATITIHTDIGDAPIVIVPAGAVGPLVLDLGLMYQPTGDVPATLGLGPKKIANLASVGVYAKSSIASGTLDWDYFRFVPADEEYSSTAITVVGGVGEALVIDGPNDASYNWFQGSPDVLDDGSPAGGEAILRGGTPKLSPGVDNLLVMSMPRSDVEDVLADSYELRLRYWPGYLTP